MMEKPCGVQHDRLGQEYNLQREFQKECIVCRNPGTLLYNDPVRDIESRREYYKDKRLVIMKWSKT